ncbi:MAG: ABC transporter ATP-binding protein [Candidatus Omnitrophota bacterium]
MFDSGINQDRLKLKDVKEGFRFFLRFNKYILRYWKIQLPILIIGNATMMLGLVNPYIGKLILDKGILARNFNVFILFTIISVTIFFISILSNIAYDYLKNYALVNISIDLNRDVFRRLKKYSLSQLQMSSTGVRIFRIVNDIGNASEVINVTLVHIINSIIKMIFITAIIIFINPLFLLIIIVYQFLVIIRMRFFVKSFEELKKMKLKAVERLFHSLNNFFSHLYLSKTFGTMGREIGRYMHSFFEHIRLHMRGVRLGAIAGFISSISDKFFFGALAFYGAYLVIKGEITLGTMGAMLAYISQGVGAYTELTSLCEKLVFNKISLERVAKVLDEPLPENLPQRGGVRPQDLRRIEFRQVSFGYQANKEIIKGLNFSIEAGSHIGLVGHSGCGKTTLLSLILGLYPVENGKILLADSQLEAIDSAYLLYNIGIVLQEPFLFDGTIAYNISYALNEARDKDIIEAARLSDIYSFVNSLPKKFDTTVGENAYRLSQGQKQRIAIARALIKRPQILILDEAMSSLDSETESKIIANIKNKFSDSTIILVSHRLSAVKTMDTIYYFKGPHIMHIGSHDKLLDELSDYREFFREQI